MFKPSQFLKKLPLKCIICTDDLLKIYTTIYKFKVSVHTNNNNNNNDDYIKNYLLHDDCIQFERIFQGSS